MSARSWPEHHARLDVSTPRQVARLGTILGIWAHPDDETFLSAGLMALARRAGSRVVCATVTRGEHGTDDPVRWPPGRLGRTRDLEVAAAMAVLGVDEHRCVGLEDGTLADHDPADGAALVARMIEEVRPDTIVTFGPDGMTGHSDHRAVSGWVSEGWEQAAGGGRLLHATTTDIFADEFADLHDEVPVFGPGLPLRRAPEEIAVAVHLDDELQDVKLAALRTQATQIAPLVDAVGEDRFRTWWRTETFAPADHRRSHGDVRDNGRSAVVPATRPGPA